jgi:predicted permease
MVRPGVREYFRLRGRRGPGISAEVNEEIEMHIELRTQELMACGLSEEAARQEAEQRFGELARARLQLQRRAEERERRMSVRAWLSGWRQDFEYSARALSREPLLAIVIVLTLALGIGANATIFGIVDQLLLRGPAHVQAPDQVKRIYITQPQWDGGIRTSAETNYVTAALMRDVPFFDGVSVYRYSEERIGRGAPAVEQWVGWSSADLFSLLGVRPAIGRFFTEAEDRPGEAERVAVLEYGYWQSAFGGTAAALGSTVVVDGSEFTIIGVAPRGFTGPELKPATLWLPFSSSNWRPRPDWPTTWLAQWTNVLVRLRPGVSIEATAEAATARFRTAAADAGMTAAATATLAVLPASYTSAGLEPPEVAITRWLAGVSFIVLLVACANVINLLLARGVRRRRELSVRLALGISRARLARLLLSESLLLAIVGGALSVLFVLWGSQLLRGALMPDIQWESPLSGRVLLFSSVVIVITGVVVGLAPALQAARQDLAGMLKANTRQGGAARGRFRGALTVTQSAFALVLLVGAGLFVRSHWNVRTLDLGIDADRVLAVWVVFQSTAGMTDAERESFTARRAAFHEEAVERLRARPDVEAAAVALGTPLQGGFGVSLRVPGRDSLPAMPGGGPYITAAGPGYFETVGTRIVRGRGIEAGDGRGSEPVTVINETMARTLWPGSDPLDACLFIGGDDAPCARIVGVAADARRRQLVEEPAFQYYVPFGQERGIGGTQILVRPKSRAATFVPELRSVLHGMEPGVGYLRINPLQATLDPQVRPWRLGATMFLVFGGLALLIAAIGLYSVIAYGVAQRRTELGVRMALGAGVAGIVVMVLRQGLALVLIGIALGLPLALFGARRIESLLFETAPADVTVFGGVALLLVVIAVLASVLPAARAGRTDPAEALRPD